MNGEIWSLGMDELVEFEEKPDEVWYFRKITDHFREIYGIHLK